MKLISHTLVAARTQSTHLDLELLALLDSQAVRLGDDGDDVDDLAELLHDDNVNGAERVARRVDEEQAAVDARVLDVAVALRGELLAEVRAVLVLDVLHNGVPASRRWKQHVRIIYNDL